MGLTRSFRTTVRERAERDPEFRAALLSEAVQVLLGGGLEEGKALLRDYVNATLGFAALARLTGKSSKSLMRMLSNEGNPRAENLFSLIDALQKQEGVSLGVHPQRRSNTATQGLSADAS